MLPGDLQARYQPLRILGEGGFGRVVAARDLELERPVAIKLLHASLADPESIGRFRREAEVTARVRHPHVVALLDSGVLPDGTPYLVYEHIEGRDLESEPPGPAELPAIATAIAEALATAHAAGVIHRDVKPANVLRRGPGDPVLADFGIARVDGGGTQYTAEGLILGTPVYMAPELYLGKPPSPASDQFAWAASLVVMAGGGSVYGTDEVAEILARVRRPDPVVLGPGAAQALGALGPAVRRALQANPAARFPDAEAFARALAGGAAETAPRATVQMEGPGDLADSTVAFRPPTLASTSTTRKLLVGDGSLRALALRGLVASGLAAAAGWAILGGPRPAPVALPPKPVATAPATTDLLAARSARLAETAAALRACLAPVDARFDRPSFEQLVDSYPKLTRLDTRRLWREYLEALELWLRVVPEDQLGQEPAWTQLLRDGVSLPRRVLTYLREVRFNLQQNRTGIKVIALINDNQEDRQSHDTWDLATIHDLLEGELLRSSEEMLCRLDDLLFDEKPGAALSLSVFATLLDLFAPSVHLEAGHRCRETAPDRIQIYLPLLYLQAREAQDFPRMLPWLKGLTGVFQDLSDAGLLPPEQRVEYLSDLADQVERLGDGVPTARRLEAWTALTLEAWRAPYRDPDAPREPTVVLLDRLLKRLGAVAGADPRRVQELVRQVRNIQSQNMVSAVPELEARLPRLMGIAQAADKGGASPAADP